MEKKSLVEYKEKIVTKIKKAFKKIFKIFKRKDKKMENDVDTTVQGTESFAKSLEVEQDKEKARIENLQESYKKGIILEEDINKEDYEKLISLYKEQNQDMRNEIARKKVELKKLIDSLKVS